MIDFFYKVLCLPMFFLGRKKSMVLEDLQYWKKRYGKEDLTDFKAFCYFMKYYPEYRYVFYYRMPFLYRHLFNVSLPRLKSVCISTNCSKVGGGIFACHGFSSIIVADSIGKNFVFFQNVTVGYNRGGIPTIGDNVQIFAGAVVAGPIHIGNDVKIGANAVVLQDIPDGSIVYGNPCIIKSKN